MKIRLHNGHDDHIDLSGTENDIRSDAMYAIARMGWKEDDCYSEKINHP